ncbi:hypothetical protein C4J81_07310 [Deltaproteobacteria bacterium Smac51]|nr:hypothetical protein C4J81_07310 [Deltaproteobacteria bacterium Smac51]
MKEQERGFQPRRTPSPLYYFAIHKQICYNKKYKGYLMKDTFKHQTVADRDDLAMYLRALADGLERGELPVAENGRSFSLNPRGLVNLTIKVRRKDGRNRVNLDLNWAEENIPTPLLDDLETGESE